MNISHELQYSSQFWVHHLINSGSYSVVYERTLCLLLINFTTIFWVECLSLLGKLNRGIVCIQKLQIWLKGTSSCFSSLSSDFYNFMVKFYTPIQESSPHIYLSALPFCPKQSIIYQRCTSLTQNRIQLLDHPTSWRANHVIIHIKGVTFAIFKPDSHIIYTGNRDGTIKSWDGYSGYSFGSLLIEKTTEISGLVVSQQHNILYASTSHSILTWDLLTGQQLGQTVQYEKYITRLALAPDDRYLIIGFMRHIVAQFLECDCDDIMSSELFITPSGWLVFQEQLILWIPPWYRQSLVCPQVLCLPVSVPNQCLKVDWSRFVHGTNWLQILDD
ncbi:hypothetical protein BDN72DRAFT_782313 [Pluteus cervinus]|uniref:Uncharacterized protein n=1 Tax=Pluteus cervinus TaxID=181527 RepID=A0ACD2ZXY7_9AGAR|nr:hypothetical protein BDN72DRAFT_782313 [Pluteus cervinus]